jgi:hypothetical protein
VSAHKNADEAENNEALTSEPPIARPHDRPSPEIQKSVDGASPRRIGRAAASTILCRAMALGGALACAAVIAYLGVSGNLGRLSGSGLLLFVAAPAVVAIALADVALRQQEPVVTRVAAEFALLAVSLLVVEAAMTVFAPQTPRSQATQIRKAAADRLGLPFDTRTVSDVVTELRRTGVDALPGIAREWALSPAVHERLPDDLYPLSHASQASVVECNEDGHYLVYGTDEFGFNNPRGLLASGRVDVAAVGESHTLGHCQPPEHSLIGILRRTFPDTANLGMAGSRTLSMLGTFREYVEPLRPRLVLWVVSPYFVADDSGLKNPILSRYLDPTFSQHLRDRQDEIDQAVRSIAPAVQAEGDREARRAQRQAEANRYRGIPVFSQFRARLRPRVWRSSADVNLEPFLQAVPLAAQTTRRWGGELVVLIVPMYGEVVGHELPEALGHENLTRRLSERGIPVIDGVQLFLDQRDPAGLYTMRMNNHPTPQGYALLTRYVISELERRLPQTTATLRAQAAGATR